MAPAFFVSSPVFLLFSLLFDTLPLLYFLTIHQTAQIKACQLCNITKIKLFVYFH